MKKESQMAKFTVSKLDLGGGDDDSLDRNSDQPAFPETCEIEDPHQNNVVPQAHAQSFHPKIVNDTPNFAHKIKKLRSNMVGEFSNELQNTKSEAIAQENERSTINSDIGQGSSTVRKQPTKKLSKARNIQTGQSQIK